MTEIKDEVNRTRHPDISNRPNAAVACFSRLLKVGIWILGWRSGSGPRPLTHLEVSSKAAVPVAGGVNSIGVVAINGRS